MFHRGFIYWYFIDIYLAKIHNGDIAKLTAKSLYFRLKVRCEIFLRAKLAQINEIKFLKIKLRVKQRVYQFRGYFPIL